jgi:hypothetical protein
MYSIPTELFYFNLQCYYIENVLKHKYDVEYSPNWFHNWLTAEFNGTLVGSIFNTHLEFKDEADYVYFRLKWL